MMAIAITMPKDDMMASIVPTELGLPGKKNTKVINRTITWKWIQYLMKDEVCSHVIGGTLSASQLLKPSHVIIHENKSESAQKAFLFTITFRGFLLTLLSKVTFNHSFIHAFTESNTQGYSQLVRSSQGEASQGHLHTHREEEQSG